MIEDKIKALIVFNKEMIKELHKLRSSQNRIIVKAITQGKIDTYNLVILDLEELLK